MDVTQTGKGCGRGWDVGLVKRWDTLRRVGMCGGMGSGVLLDGGYGMDKNETGLYNRMRRNVL